ncbi:MAG: sigma-54-dependent Fis family transcriptional regulator, partial [Acidobacteria bacterium]|nr:sigma-54-dependent Fis family transcriptional regulator [Acidobacteriota bacterium]
GGGGDIGACLRMAIDKTRTLERKRLENENRRLAAEVEMHRSREGGGRQLVGESPALAVVRERIERVAPSDVRVLITGESGTGKEVAARLIHQASRRASGPFIEVNCAAIPEELIESELFGAERGSYTGAHRQMVGKFEQADGGTLFLDEVGDMSARTQAKVLRALEENRITRVGGSKSVEVDVRVLSATNQDLEQESFRSDLLHRLNVIPIEMPPLRDRPGDVPLLVAHFVEQLEVGGQPRTFTGDALELLARQPFPGNVRELRNLVERILILSPGAEMGEADVREHL